MRRIRTVVVALLAIGITTIVMASPAQAASDGNGKNSPVATSHPLSAQADADLAGASCSFGCSETVNQSAYGITAFRNWCQGGITSSYTTTKPTCTVDGVAQDWRWISPGNPTPAGVDWDGFRVDAGWCYEVFFDSYLFGPIWAVYNRSGKSSLYVKVGNDATAYVQAQRYGSCP